MAEELERLAYEIATWSVERQERVLSEIRSQTATLLGASALVASFLGGLALDRGGLGLLASLALVTSIGSVLLSVYVLLPRPDLVFALRGGSVLASLPSAPRRAVIERLDAFASANEPTINDLARAFRAAAFLLVLEVGLWAVQLGNTVRG